MTAGARAQRPRLGNRPKLHDVAARAGVSPGTVSNALNHPDRVAGSTLERINVAIAELGFTRDGAASALASGVSRTVGLVVTDLMNSLFVDMARGAQRAARAEGLDLQLADSDNDPEQQRGHLEFLHRARTGGVLLAPGLDPHEDIALLRDWGKPFVLVNYRSHQDDCCAALIDNEQVGYLAARHLIDLGRRRLAFVGGNSQAQPVILRRQGVLRAVAESPGVSVDDVPTPDLNPPSGTLAGAQLVATPRRRRPDAVLAVTDLLAMAVIGEFAAAGVRVPDDVAVMGCDHNSVAWGGVIPLTSVTMRGQELGEAGMKLLLEELAEPVETHRHRTITLEPSVVVRESTAGR
ncbi:LacI family DNA-binding transcriptional regulator [Kineosporia sp. NBRC 101731]|uniref:LacI family DNA-binding transcriptional regulator n=1 Tax=Kineosporia sp. NBRC 101731 TaxID=3032199 RepID=UPI0024A3E80C|nr:LacI family DNA-binding transcriptional regulator [Kineosporia sp. NBRC 101731]GLY29741.1 transcriptional regulator [Kineosporia sp. NBRC 101731]